MTMMTFKSVLTNNLVERALWTLAQAGSPLVTVDSLHIPVAYAPVVALVLSAVKTAVQQHVTAVTPTSVEAPSVQPSAEAAPSSSGDNV